MCDIAIHSSAHWLSSRLSAAGDTWAEGKIIMRAGNITCSPDKMHQRLKQMTTSDVNDGAPLWDRTTNTIWLPYVHGAVCGVGHGDSVMIISSKNKGETWSAPRNLTSSLPAIYAIGPGHGVQVHTGKHAGRLIFCGKVVMLSRFARCPSR